MNACNDSSADIVKVLVIAGGITLPMLWSGLAQATVLIGG